MADRNTLEAVLNWLVSFLPADLWKGAMQGVVVSGVSAATALQAKRQLRRSPVEALPGLQANGCTHRRADDGLRAIQTGTAASLPSPRAARTRMASGARPNAIPRTGA